MAQIIDFIEEEKNIWHWAYKAITTDNWKKLSEKQLYRLIELKEFYGHSLPKLPPLIIKYQDFFKARIKGKKANLNLTRKDERFNMNPSFCQEDSCQYWGEIVSLQRSKKAIF